jgi:molybdopterin synthase catalytic subunit
MIEVKLLFFAGQRDIVGQSEAHMRLEPGTTLGTLWEQLTADHPQLKKYHGHVLYAVNQEFSPPATVLNDGDEVAFVPPVSGGTTDRPELFAVTTMPLVAQPLEDLVQTPTDGALVTFAGVVRNTFDGRATAYLTYEAYGAMVVAVLRQIAAEAQAAYAIGQVAIHHRVGQLQIGETAVLVVVAAPHRQAALDAVGYIMNRIKEIAPIWKREHWGDGTTDWRDTPDMSNEPH